MSEKNVNLFRFSLYQEDLLLCEKIFDADDFNPFTRYSIDIRELLPHAITKLQKMLSKKRYETQFENYSEYDFGEYAQNMIDAYPEKWRRNITYNPKPMKHHIEDKVIKGVECKIGFYINDNPIVERIFYVDGFNPLVRYSADVMIEVITIADKIFEHIKKVDVQNMWDDYDLINRWGFSINQIREFSSEKRRHLLRKTHCKAI